MRRVLIHLRDSGPVYVAAVMAAMLQALGLAAASNWSFAAFTNAAEPGIIQNYVLFTQVRGNGFTVTTGTQYASSGEDRIDKEWCYAQRGTSATDLVTTTLATIDASGTLTRTSPAIGSLTAFNLTIDEARGLVDSHCRFQQGHLR